MIRTSLLRKLNPCILSCGVAVIAVWVLLAGVSGLGAQNPSSPKVGVVLASPSPASGQAALVTPKPKAEAKKSHVEMTKTDAAELSALADQLRDELNKMNINVLSLRAIQKTEEVEKLAKKIKAEAYEH